MAKSEPAYPDLAKLIAKGLADSKRAGYPYTIREASKKLGDISTATFAAWKGGYRAPRTQNITALAELFYPNDSDKRSAFISDLMAAVAIKSGGEDKRDNLAVPLHMSAVSYEPLSLPHSKGGGFLDQFLRRLVVYGDLKQAGEFDEAVLGDVGERLNSGLVDVVAGVMSTVDRNKDLRFFSTPISLPVNAVILRDHFEEFRTGSKSKPLDENTAQVKLQEYLSPPEPDPRLVHLHPIVRPTEVGGLYCRLALGLQTDEGSNDVTLATDYSAAAYLKALQNHTVRQEKYPVVVVDELMCLNILEQAQKQAKGMCRLIFDLTDNDALMPRYSVGVAVAKYRENLISYLEDVFSIYLRADSNYLVHRYKKLYEALCGVAKRAGFDDDKAQSWARCTLSLDQVDATLDLGYSPGWNSLLRRVNERLKNSDPSSNQTQSNT